MNARKGIKTIPVRQDWGLRVVIQSESMNARKGIKTEQGGLERGRLGLLSESMNARKGIKTIHKHNAPCIGYCQNQ